MDEGYIEIDEDGEPVFLSGMTAACGKALLLLLAGIAGAGVRFAKRVHRG